MSINFGSVRITDTGESEIIEHDETSKRRWSSGVSHTYLITCLPNLEARVAYVDWKNGDREIRGLPGSRPSRLFTRFATGNRVSISSHNGFEWMQLRVSKITSRQPEKVWSNPRKISVEQLNDACGFDVALALKELGAVGVDTRVALIGTKNKNRTDLCVLFQKDEIYIPLAAFASIRVIPISREEK
ncbi:MAG: hypothetical protein IH971_04345 [Candidatus Marinimicrobia bacterium]|nr:hypothetical protein [Candidatus Neomarinimicrobiota bacterium]